LPHAMNCQLRHYSTHGDDTTHRDATKFTSKAEPHQHDIQVAHPLNLHKPYITTNLPEGGQGSSKPHKHAPTPLTTSLTKRIHAHGPMPVSFFMQECLFNENHGYYSTKSHIFGKEGDFITSPEISSIFSEMMALWVVSEAEKLHAERKKYLGKYQSTSDEPLELCIVELGPGRGTLIKDILKTIEKTGKWNGKDGNPLVKPRVVLVEKSPVLREEQRSNLQQKAVFDSATREATNCISYANASIEWKSTLEEIIMEEEEKEKRAEEAIEKLAPSQGTPPRELTAPPAPIILLAHEFFDALPVNQFQYTEKGWCEYMVDTDEDSSSPEHFKYVLSPGSTPNCLLAKARAKVSPLWVNKYQTQEQKLGRNLEVSSDAITYMQQIGHLLHLRTGSALIVDYGYRAEIADNDLVLTMQGIKEHKNVHPLSEPGLVDLSTFVDFYLLMRSVSHIPTIRAAKVLSQRDFLYRMGIDARMMRLMMHEAISDKDIQNVYSAFTRLTDPADMGDRFKMLCISTNDLPTAFEDIRAKG